MIDLERKDVSGCMVFFSVVVDGFYLVVEFFFKKGVDIEMIGVDGLVLL